MLQEFRDNLLKIIKSRLFVLMVLFIVATCLILYRLFDLQIVHGEEYLENYQLKIVRERNISSTRGNIYDRNGYLLAYNELAYSVTLEDVYDDSSNKNAEFNETIVKLIELIEKNGDEIVSDFPIYVNEDDEYCFSLSDTQLLRFLADIYGRKYTDDLKFEERTATPDEVVDYLCQRKVYGIGYYEVPGDKSTFVPGGGYTKEQIIKIINMRYAVAVNSYKKYIYTIVAKDISDETMIVILENMDTLRGVNVIKDTVRRYNDGVYFSQIIGYTGKISQEEYDTYSANNDNYSLSDYVGKTGIEYSMEEYLQGIKGSETIYVDNMGKILESTNYVEPVAGKDIYLTIDKDLQIAVYNILEQKIAGILVNKIRNVKEYVPSENASSSDIIIPIDDVYFALFDNNVIDVSRFEQSYASDTEAKVLNAFNASKEEVLSEIRTELLTTGTPYNELPKEYQNYESYIVTMLKSDNNGILNKSVINTEDPIYVAWTIDENISLKEFLTYAISQNWIDTSKLDLNQKYSDSEEIYNVLVDVIIDKLDGNREFGKKIYKYMIRDGKITGKDVCIILWEQDIINVDEDRIVALKSGTVTSYDFMLKCISNLEITPAMLALEPCSGSCVIVDVNTGDVLACVSYPSYNNDKLANSSTSAYLVKLNQDKSNPLWNYATQYRSAPGSTFKMVSSICGVENGVIDLNSNIECTGTFDKLTGTVHHCWIYPGRHGNLNLTEGIANSCNCFFYEVGYRLSQDEDGYNANVGIDKIAETARMFGLGDKSGMEINEVEPMISDEFPVPSAIGQGNHAFTTAGLARYVTAVANKGTVYDLTLVDKIYNSNGNLYLDNNADVYNTITIDPSVWSAVHQGMREVVQNKVYYDIGVEVAGKTGTAQESTSKPNHGLFVGFAPYQSPEIAFSIKIMNGYSSDYAAQVGKDIAVYYFDLADKEEIITGTADEPLNVTTGGD